MLDKTDDFDSDLLAKNSYKETYQRKERKFLGESKMK
jgi:hypothetical protein